MDGAEIRGPGFRKMAGLEMPALWALIIADFDDKLKAA
jgi:hypothetical protein